MPSSIALTPNPEPSGWNPLVILSVAAVCIIILLFSYYRILQEVCCVLNGVTFPRNRVQRQLLIEENPDDPSLQFHSHGLESSIVHSLPITQFKKNEEEPNLNNSDCAVCLGEFEEGEWLKHLPNCTHAYHVSCIDTWFQCHSNCPLCRSQITYLTLHHEVSMNTSLETLRREDFFQERAAHYQIVRTGVLQSSAHRREPTDAN